MIEGTSVLVGPLPFASLAFLAGYNFHFCLGLALEENACRICKVCKTENVLIMIKSTIQKSAVRWFGLAKFISIADRLF